MTRAENYITKTIIGGRFYDDFIDNVSSIGVFLHEVYV